MPESTVIHVVRNTYGWWEVRRQSGEVIARYSSEIQAVDAGRVAAVSSESNLMIHQLEGATLCERFDPASRQMQPEEDIRDHEAPESAAERRHLILIVEDMVDARELYADYLGFAGFSVVTALNGHEAVGLARLLKPDLILMDIRLPGMDGLEAAADIKADPAITHIPIVAITADSSRDIHARAKRVGCSTVIMKPVLPGEVVLNIRSLLAAVDPQPSTS